MVDRAAAEVYSRAVTVEIPTRYELH